MYSKSKNTKHPVIQKPSPVTLALQLSSGERLTTDFKPEASLWEILEHWEKEGKLDPPLATLTNDVPACVYLRKEIAREDSLRKTSLADLGLMNGKAAIRYISKPDGPTEQQHVGGFLAPKQTMTEDEDTSISTATSQPVALVSTEQQATKEEEKKNHHEDVEMLDVTVVTSQQSAVVEIAEQGSVDVLMEVKEEDVKIELSHVQITSKPVERAVVHAHHDDGRTLNFLNEAGFLVYVRPESLGSSVVTDDGDLPDDFFELTENEIRGRMLELTRNREALEGAHFLTAKQRAEQEEERLRKVLQRYPLTMLRVQFSDGFVLQMPMPSDSTISKAKNELLKFIAGDVTEKDFEIFTAPPKNVLDTSTPLHLLGLTPSSLVYISSLCALKEEYCSSPSSFTAAVHDAYTRITAQDVLKEEKTVEQPHKRNARGAKAGENISTPKWLKLSKK